MVVKFAKWLKIEHYVSCFFSYVVETWSKWLNFSMFPKYELGGKLDTARVSHCSLICR